MKKMHKLVWFEIPVIDLDRAQRFYEAVFQRSLERRTMEGMEIVFFGSMAESEGALVRLDGYEPSQNGLCVYFDVGDEMPAILDRAAANGGAILSPKTLIAPDIGFDAKFRDSEGNRIGLYAKE